MYNVLVPEYIPSGRDASGKQQFRVEWTVVGKANSMEEAKKITKIPVLEEV